MLFFIGGAVEIIHEVASKARQAKVVHDRMDVISAAAADARLDGAQMGKLSPVDVPLVGTLPMTEGERRALNGYDENSIALAIAKGLRRTQK